MQNEKETPSSNEENWAKNLQKIISQVDEESGLGEQPGSSRFFRILDYLKSKSLWMKLLVSVASFFIDRFRRRGVPSASTAGSGYLIINLVRALLYRMIPIAGIAAALVSATIECKVLTNIYDYAPMELSEITYNVPKKGLSWWNHLLGRSDNKNQPESEQPDASKKQKSWLPLMTVFAFETSKCFLIFYAHTETSGYADFSRVTRVLIWGVCRLLIVVSLICSLIFFAGVMNQPRLDDELAKKHDEIENQYEKLREREESSTNEEIKRLEKRVTEVRRLKEQEIRGGLSQAGRGYGPNADKLDTDLREYENDIKKTRESGLDKLRKLGEDEQGEKDDAETDIANTPKADPEWMRKTLDMIHKLSKGDNAGDYPRSMAYWCIGIVSGIVTAVLECIIWCVFAVIGRESST